MNFQAILQLRLEKIEVEKILSSSMLQSTCTTTISVLCMWSLHILAMADLRLVDFFHILDMGFLRTLNAELFIVVRLEKLTRESIFAESKIGVTNGWYGPTCSGFLSTSSCKKREVSLSLQMYRCLFVKCPSPWSEHMLGQGGTHHPNVLPRITTSWFIEGYDLSVLLNLQN